MIMSLIGKTLGGRYRILQKIAEGGFGDTYRAIDYNLPGKPVCVVKHLKSKSIRPPFLQLAKNKFDAEAQTLYRLGNNSEQIPRLFAHFEEENEQFYLVQEFVDGDNLTKEIFSGYFKTEAKLLQLVIDILEVLAFVHQQNVIHRDLKPQNIMRRRTDGKIVLIDFGAIKEVATLTVNPQGQIDQTVSIGTPGYMPSEQQSGRPFFSSDVYAVGIIAFQALTGLYSNPLELPRDSVTGELSCALFPEYRNISPGFATILDQMVRYDYRQRYKNATAALEDLHNLLKVKQGSRVVLPLNSSLNDTPPQNAYDNSSVSTQWKPSWLRRIIEFFRYLFVEPELEDVYPPSNIPSNPSNIANIPPESTIDLEQPEGQVRLMSNLYIPRPPIENDCYQTIVRPGALIRIKAPRQMGKTSLLSRTLNYARSQGARTAYLNFQSADAEFLNSLNRFLRWFCGSIAQELNLPDKLDEYWQGVLGSKNNCTNYFQRYLLSEIRNPIVLGLDEVDQLFQYPQVASEFFALLRAWHEKSKNQVTWQKLRLAIVHSKEVYIPLNINQSPFNVGLPIDLPEFNKSQVEELVRRHHLNWSEQEVSKLMTMVGGHPYLVRLALHEIARGRIDLFDFLEVASTEQGMFSDHLRRHLYNLQEDKKLVSAMKQIITSSNAVRLDTSLAFKLRSMGLVKFHGNYVAPLCNLYRLYFQENLR